MRTFIVSICLFLVLMSCSSSEEDIHIRLIDKVTASHVKKMNEQYGARACMYGGNCNDGTVNYIGIGLDKKGHFNIDQARKQIILQVQEYLKEINSSEEVRAYLVHYPFTYEDLSYGVSFVNEEGGFQKVDKENKYNSIASVLCSSNGVTYNYYDDPEYGLQKLHRETFEEAIEILKEQGEDPF